VPLYHFSDEPGIDLFQPRPVRVPVERGSAGRDWLNGPLVWAIDEAHQVLYFFPRECPRILLWARPTSVQTDIDVWLRGSKRIAFIERAWLERLRAATIHRYALPCAGFEPLGDVGMHVCRRAVRPTGVEALSVLPDRLAEAEVELRVLDDLTSLRGAWETSLHASGLRLRNAQGWKG
jgi:hypothetical protein